MGLTLIFFESGEHMLTDENSLKFSKIKIDIKV